MKMKSLNSIILIFTFLLAWGSRAAQADLGAIMSVSQTNVTDTSNLTFTVSVTNAGPSLASNVLVALHLPGFNLTQSSSTQGTITNTPDGLACSVASLTANGGAFQITANGFFDIFGDELEKTIVTNRADVSANEVDPFPVNNHPFAIVNVIRRMDFGDAPDGPYPTLLVNNGARHRISGLFLGFLIDSELNGLPNANANGDDTTGAADEDGVVFLNPLVPNTIVNVQVRSSLAGRLDAWIDFNQNGVWEAAEQIFANVPLAAGLNGLNFNIPNFIPLGRTYARFRLSGVGGLAPTGYYKDGEVEDYAVNIVQQANLAANMTASQTNVTETSNLTFTVAITNSGPGSASNVLATLHLPGFIVAQTSTTLGSISNTADGLACSVSNLPPSGTFLVTASGAFASFPGNLETVTVTNRTDVNANELDPVPADNVALVAINLVRRLDFGDAPDAPYPTLRASNGARHRASQLFLGAQIDYEADGSPSPTATLDDTVPFAPDDEDGVAFVTPLFTGSPATINVVASAAGKLDAWIDFNQNGIWDAPEQIFISAPVVAGLNALNFNIPPAIPTGYTFARFRLSSAGGLAPTGYANDGEVEDYRIYVRPSVPIAHVNAGLSGGTPVITWDAPETVLESASALDGPWVSLTGAKSPYTPATNAAQSFFRLRSLSGQTDLGLMLRKADLVFDGTVSNVQYRISSTDQAHPVAIPHTFVTFQVNQVLKGQVAGSTICLRFAGGPTPEGEIFRLDHPSLFDTGERSILFMRRNGQIATPLVDGADGRFRLVGGQVYNEDGAEVLWTTEGRLTFGEDGDLAEVATNYIGTNLLGRLKVLDQSESGQEPAPQGEHLTTARFKSILNSFLQHTHSPQELANPIVAQSCDAALTFYVPSPKATAPPFDPPDPGFAAPITDPEAIRLQQNGGNPVFK
jgi:hypothetical protein